MDLKDLIKRHFTKELENNKDLTVFDLFKWKTVDVVLKHRQDNSVIYEGLNLEFPEFYSQNACEIIASKYFKRAGVPNDRGYEYSLKQILDRMVRFLVESAEEEKLVTTPEQAKILYDEAMYIMISQRFALNSPQWFNTGLKYYGNSEKSDGHYYYDKKLKKVVQTKNRYDRTQASACFITQVEDRLLGEKSISEQFIVDTRLFKQGSGVGTNYSNIRAKGEHLSGGGTSSGVLSFLRGFDSNAGTIKSGGLTRRSARLIALDYNHPEIIDFIKWKAKEEQKVRDLGKMGYSIEFDGEAYSTVSGQNGNNSVRFSDEVMTKVEKYILSGINEDIELVGRVDKTINRTIKTSELWDSFCKASWECADPAPQFDDTFNAWHTCPCGEDGKYNVKHNRINSTNPCSEYAFLDDTSCNLGSMNLVKFYNYEKDTFLLDDYNHTITIATILLEASINCGQFPTEDIARRTHLFRTLGLGISNVGGLLMLMALPYDSELSREVIGSLTAIMTGRAYTVSSLISKQIGSFECYDINKEHMLRVIRNHCKAVGVSLKELEGDFEGLNYKPHIINSDLLYNNKREKLVYNALANWQNAFEYGKKYGYRNAQTSVIAPCGTIGFALDCATTSIEPFFSHTIYKKLVGGGGMMIVNPYIGLALNRLGYSESEIEDIINYVMRSDEYGFPVDGNIENAPHIKKEHLPVFDTANKCGTGERYIKPMGHIKMLSVLSPLISGSISKTTNLPKSATVEEISDIFYKTWKMGIKCNTVYRDGCKASQPLNSVIEESGEILYENMNYNDLVEIARKNSNPTRKRADGITSGKTHRGDIDGVKIYVTVNRNEDNTISEVYLSTDRVGSIITGLLNALSKSISVMLQYNLPVKDIANMLKGQKFEPNGYVERHPNIKFCDSISDFVSRVLEIEIGDFSRCQIKPENGNNEIEYRIEPKQIIEDKVEKIHGEICSNCGSSRMIQNGVCKICLDCSTTTGCS